MPTGNNILQAVFINPQVILSQQLGTTDTALYTVPTGYSVKIAQGTLCNVTSSAVTVYLSIIKTGGTVGDGTHRVISGYTIAANDSLSLKDYIGGHMLGPGDILAAYAGTASAVDIVVSGTVHS
jgi:hypothetical protein